MDFQFTDEQKILRETIIRFSRKELSYDIRQHEKEGSFPWEAWRKCAEMHLMALPFAEKYGGCGFDLVTTVHAIMAFGYACKDAGLVHAIATQILCGLQMSLFGSESLKETYLPVICSGEKVFAQAITEPGSGSDALAMRTRGEKRNGRYVLDGTKIFISNGPMADAVIVFAVTDPEKRTLGGISCFVVEKETAGFERCKPFEKMGLSTLQNGELVFAGCEIPPARMLGREGQGAIIFNESMEWERTLLPAAHLGTLERILETCIDHARERTAFGRQIGSFQSISHKIADMKVQLELGKMMLWKSACLKDQQKRATLEASICKLFISESLKQACLDAVQIHGGYGYMAECELERDLRDSIAATIYSGTSEIQRNIIGRFIGL